MIITLLASPQSYAVMQSKDATTNLTVSKSCYIDPDQTGGAVELHTDMYGNRYETATDNQTARITHSGSVDINLSYTQPADGRLVTSVGISNDSDIDYTSTSASYPDLGGTDETLYINYKSEIFSEVPNGEEPANLQGSGLLSCSAPAGGV